MNHGLEILSRTVRYQILDQGQIIDLSLKDYIEWETNNPLSRVVGKTYYETHGLCLSTVFIRTMVLSPALPEFPEPPFETLLWSTKGKTFEKVLAGMRYRSYEEAAAGHEKLKKGFDKGAELGLGLEGMREIFGRSFV